MFIECGALDGETRSNSLFLEMQNDWRGILIEADPMSLAKIRYLPIHFNFELTEMYKHETKIYSSIEKL